MEVQAHSAIAVAGRIQLAVETVGVVAGLCAGLAYIPFQAFRIWRKMRALASIIESEYEHDPAAPKPADADVQHALTSLREVHGAVLVVTSQVRSTTPFRLAYGPMLGAIERDNEILRDFLEDAEMRLSPEFKASVQAAISELKPPTGADWKASLESMRH
jgi:hypothetical protein